MKKIQSNKVLHLRKRESFLATFLRFLLRESFLATFLKFLLRLALRSLAHGKCPSVGPQKFT